MEALFERDCAEHVHWHPYVTVEKYSPDQGAWAEARFAELRSWKRLPLIRKAGLERYRVSPLVQRAAATWVGTPHGPRLQHHGDWLRDIFPHGPEDGYAYDDGNILVNVGLTNITNLLTGAAASGANSRPMKNGQCGVGVGTSSTAATTADTALGNQTTNNAYYQGSDATYPSLTGPATINNQMTAASGNANFAWNEWCWFTGDSINGSPANTWTLANLITTGADAAMVNHKISSLGTKASGASWVFSTTIVFS